MSYIWRAAYPSWITHSKQGGPSALQLRRCGIYNFHKEVFIGQTTLPLAPYLMSSGPKKMATSLNRVYYHILALWPAAFFIWLVWLTYCEHNKLFRRETFKEDFLAEYKVHIMGLYVLESRLEQHGLASYKGSLSVCLCVSRT